MAFGLCPLLSFLWEDSAMSSGDDTSLLSDVERAIKQRFSKEEADRVRVPSTARDASASARVDQLTLPLSERGKMPHTKDKYLVRENPHLVAWEREVRVFLRKLSPDHEHRVAAVMIYEWATGMKVAELMQLEQKGQPGRQSWRSDLRKINQVLKFYFGETRYMTYIMGKKVPNCYKVRRGYLIRRHRPMTLTLYAEYQAGTLNP
jgi:hypothetical protein